MLYEVITGGTRDDAFATAGACCVVDRDAAIIPLERAIIAACDAALAADADVSRVPKPDFGDQPFRVLAPLASERAAFDEYRRADAVAVVDRKAFDIEYVRRDHMSENSVRSMISRCRSGASSVKYAVYPATRMVRLV